MQAVQKLLGQLQGQPCFQEVAKTQASNIEKLLGNSQAMPAEGATRLNELVLSSAFPADIKNRLVARISNSSTTTVSRGFQRTKQQDFQTIFEYLPVDAWHTRASSEVTECAKLELLVDLCLNLGARNPSEDSFAMITALHLGSVHGIDKLAGLTWQARLEGNQQTKRVFRRRARVLMPPVGCVETLPTLPSGYQEAYPADVQRIYETKLPASCPMGEARVRFAQALIPRRNTRSGVANEKNHEHRLGSLVQPMLQTLMQQLLHPGSGSAQQWWQPGSPSASSGLQIQMLAPASGPKPLLKSASSSSLNGLLPSPEEAKEGAAEEKDIKDDVEVKMEIATDASAKPSPMPAKGGEDKVAVEMCTEASLAGLKERDAEKAKGKSKAAAKSKSKAKGKKKPITAPAPTVLPTVGKAKGKSTACAAKVVPTIAKPKPGKPVCFGQCTIIGGG